MSVTLALTCPSFLKALTSSKWDTFRSLGLLIAKYGMSHISILAVSRLEAEGDEEGLQRLCLFYFPSFSCHQRCILAGCRPLRLFMSFVSCRLRTWQYLAVVRERDNISTILFTACLPSLGRLFFPLALLFKRHTSDHTPAHAHTRTKTRTHQNRRPRCKSAHK